MVAIVGQAMAKKRSLSERHKRRIAVSGVSFKLGLLHGRSQRNLTSNDWQNQFGFIQIESQFGTRFRP
jgi:hypothetical protein